MSNENNKFSSFLKQQNALERNSFDFITVKDTTATAATTTATTTATTGMSDNNTLNNSDNNKSNSNNNNYSINNNSKNNINFVKSEDDSNIMEDNLNNNNNNNMNNISDDNNNNNNMINISEDDYNNSNNKNMNYGDELKDTNTFNFFEKHTKNRVILVTSSQQADEQVVRLERLPANKQPTQGSIQYMGRQGWFKDVMVVQGNKKRLAKICKPHVVATFYTHVHNTQDASNSPPRKEKRDIHMWTYRGLEREHQIHVGSSFIKCLLQPEHFPADMLSYIKKCILLMRFSSELKRVELHVRLMDEVQVDLPPEIPLIQNFITVMTPALYDYQYLPEVAVSNKNHVSFRVMASGDAHVALSYVYGDTDRRTYEVVIGCRNNSRCAIRYGGRGDVKVEKYTPKVLNPQEYRHFWVGWNDGVVSLGRGSEVDTDVLCEWREIPQRQRHSVNLLSVSTGPASTGTWEFVEYIESFERVKETRGEKRRRVVRGLVWWGRKEKMMDRLQQAFPLCLDTSALLSLSKVSVKSMLDAVVFLKKSQEEGNVLELGKGVWIRSPFPPYHPSPPYQDIIRNPSLPAFPPHLTPTIAIVTSLFVEKCALDAVLDDHRFYIIESPSNKEAAAGYSIGRMGNKSVVVMKVSSLSSSPSHAIQALLSHFKQLQHVMVVGVGGAVPHFSDVSKHIRRGDVIISCPRDLDAAMYVHCASLEDDVEADPTGGSAFFETCCWNAGVVGKVQEATAAVVKNPSWQRYLDEASERVTKHDERFLRPAQKSDKLLAQLSKKEQVMTLQHPASSYHYGNQQRSRVRLGVVASGQVVSRDHVYRRVFAQQNLISAYDAGLHPVMEALFASEIGGENVVMVLGMSDYLDGTITKSWQPYSSLAAAAVCKALVQLL